MLDVKTANIVRDAVNKELGINLTLEDACRMQPIPQRATGGGYTILALQCGHFTILVWVQFSESLGVLVRRVKRCAL